MTCPGCGVELPEVDGPTHRYMTSSPACWARFGEVLAADYSSAERMQFHQLVADAYAAQHPGDGSRVAAQSVGIHLMTLCLFLEHDADPAAGPRLHQGMVEVEFTPLTPAGTAGRTVVDMPSDGPVDQASEAAWAWARAVWSTYAGSHDVVRGWLRQSGHLATS